MSTADVEAIFSEALGKTTPHARAAYLDDVCADVPDLRQRVEALLDSHERIGGFLESPVIDPDATVVFEQLGRAERRFRCVAAQRETLRRVWFGDGSAPAETFRDGILDSWRLVREHRRRASGPAYFPWDQHWSRAVGAEVARILVTELDPDLWEPRTLLPSGSGPMTSLALAAGY